MEIGFVSFPLFGVMKPFSIRNLRVRAGSAARCSAAFFITGMSDRSWRLSDFETAIIMSMESPQLTEISSQTLWPEAAQRHSKNFKALNENRSRAPFPEIQYCLRYDRSFTQLDPLAFIVIPRPWRPSVLIQPIPVAVVHAPEPGRPVFVDIDPAEGGGA